MINNDLVNAELDIVETVIFNGKLEGEPTVQLVVNIFSDQTATCKFFMPKYPGEHSFEWLSQKYPDKINVAALKINDFVNSRGAIIKYMGY